MIHYALSLGCLWQSFSAALRLPILGYTVVFPFRYAPSRGCSSLRFGCPPWATHLSFPFVMRYRPGVLRCASNLPSCLKIRFRDNSGGSSGSSSAMRMTLFFLIPIIFPVAFFSFFFPGISSIPHFSPPRTPIASISPISPKDDASFPTTRMPSGSAFQ